MRARGAGGADQDPLRRAWHVGRGQGGTIPGFRRQAQRGQAQAAEGGEQAAQGKQGGKVGVHVFGFWLRSASAGAGGVAIPARYDGAGVKSKDEAGFGPKGFRRLCCEPFFL